MSRRRAPLFASRAALRDLANILEREAPDVLEADREVRDLHAGVVDVVLDLHALAEAAAQARTPRDTRDRRAPAWGGPRGRSRAADRRRASRDGPRSHCARARGAARSRPRQRGRSTRVSGTWRVSPSCVTPTRL